MWPWGYLNCPPAVIHGQSPVIVELLSESVNTSWVSWSNTCSRRSLRCNCWTRIWENLYLISSNSLGSCLGSSVGVCTSLTFRPCYSYNTTSPLRVALPRRCSGLLQWVIIEVILGNGSRYYSCDLLTYFPVCNIGQLFIKKTYSYSLIQTVVAAPPTCGSGGSHMFTLRKYSVAVSFVKVDRALTCSIHFLFFLTKLSFTHVKFKV